MIRKLKSRRRADSQRNETRQWGRSWDRAIYLAVLAFFAIIMLDYAAGDRVIMRAHGLVLRDRDVIEPTSLVRITQVHVRPGEAVAPGDILIEAQSFAVLDRLAELSMREAELTERQAALAARTRLAERLKPIYAARLSDMEARQVDLAGARRTPLRARLDSAERDLHDAQVDLARADVQIVSSAEEGSAVATARREARGAIADLTVHYDEGRHRAAVIGVVGDAVPARGEVFAPGEPMLTVLHGPAYVLAYLPDTYLFGIEVGDRVRVSGGVTGGPIAHGGVISEILPVSSSLPDEFRNAFRIDETRQMARIALDAGHPFPAFSAVTATRERGGWLPDWVRALRSVGPN